MTAYNWINIHAPCPACSVIAHIRCQTHVASSYDGDDTGRFHDRDYELGQPMSWWPRDDQRFAQWATPKAQVSPLPDTDQEACFADCTNCGAELYVVLQFRENTPIRVAELGKAADLPDAYLT